MRLLSFIILLSFFITSCHNDEPIDVNAEHRYDIRVKPKNIILFIGDGMGLAQINAATIANKDSLNIPGIPYVGLSKTNSAYNLITDSGAGGTAIACGEKTFNGYIGIGTDGNKLISILEYAEKHNLSTGLIATSSITHATPASFIAHLSNRNLEDSIATFFLQTDIDVFIGGGRAYFSNRTDGRNLIDSLLKRNYFVSFSMEDLSNVDSGKLAGLVADYHLPRYSEGRNDMFPNAVNTAINILNNNKDGFFLMAEASQIDWGGHNNDINYIIEEVQDLDRAVKIALDFARNDSNTLVIVTADHETGGLAITGGDTATGEVIAGFATSGHTGSMVPVYAIGPGAEIFTGVYHNTEIFYKMMYLYGFRQ